MMDASTMRTIAASNQLSEWSHHVRIRVMARPVRISCPG